jgi:putative membrane protein
MKAHTQKTFRPSRGAVSATALAFLVSAATLAAQSTNSSTSNRNSSGSSYDRSSSGTSGSSMDNSSHQSDMSGTGSYNSNSTQSTGSSSDKLSWSDRRFVNKVADGNQDEVQLAQLASQRASNPDVRNFAQQLVNDHTSMGSELQSLASTKNVKLDQDNNQSREYKRLSNKSGQDFDREFVDHMVDEHEKDIKDFEKASTDAKDMELRSFASKHLADLKQHLATAQNLQRSTMATGRNDNSSGRTSHSDMSTSGTSSTNSSTLDATGSNSSSTPTRDTKSSSTDNNSSNPGTSGTSGSSSAGSTR